MPSALFVTFGYNFSIKMTELEEPLKAFIPQESRYIHKVTLLSKNLIFQIKV